MIALVLVVLLVGLVFHQLTKTWVIAQWKKEMPF